MDSNEFAGIKPVERKLKFIQKGLRKTKGRAVLRSTSARWAWVEYKLAQGGPEMGMAVYRAVTEGGSFASWKRQLKAVESDKMSPWRQRYIGIQDRLGSII